MTNYLYTYPPSIRVPIVGSPAMTPNTRTSGNSIALSGWVNLDRGYISLAPPNFEFWYQAEKL